MNGKGQLIDSEAATAGWDLADEIVRLKIGDVAGDQDDIIALRTPPKPALTATAVMGSESPLDSRSNPSAGSSPQSLEHHISHSRASSIDTTNSSSHGSVASGRLLNQVNIHGDSVVNEAKERPHSFSGGLSAVDLRRLQHAGDEDFSDLQQWQEQPSYPSLSNHVHRSQPQYDARNGADREDHQIDYIQSRNYNHALPHPSFVAAPPSNGPQAMPYRQNPRGFAQQGVPQPATSPLPYPAHASHLSLGSTPQHLYDMMLPQPMHDNHPAVTRVQQQHNVFRPTHHHSASDPSAIRDAATLALLSGNMPPFTPGMFQPGMGPMMYPSQFYNPELAAMAARIQAQYPGPYPIPATAPPLSADNTGGKPGTPGGSTDGGQAPGPSANNRKLGLYKTELCRSWEEKHSCRYGAKCQFAHGEEELRNVSRHPKYKTEICRTFWVSGSCPYGKRCCFIHTELPNSGSASTPPSGVTPGAADSSSAQPDGRARSMSTNSDPNDGSTSLLQRIKNNAAASTPIDGANANFQFGSRPPTGSLRVDTTALDGPSISKQNKSAYPTFASNGILLPAPEPIRAKSPAPVTAGPDLGRYNAAARLEIVGLNGAPKKGHTTGNPRHSISGDVDFGFTPTASNYDLGNSGSKGGNGNSLGRANGHVRAGSAGNWNHLVRSNLVNSSFGRGTHSPAGDIMSASPWSSGEMAALRLNEKAWA